MVVMVRVLEDREWAILELRKAPPRCALGFNTERRRDRGRWHWSEGPLDRPLTSKSKPQKSTRLRVRVTFSHRTCDSAAAAVLDLEEESALYISLSRSIAMRC